MKPLVLTFIFLFFFFSTKGQQLADSLTWQGSTDSFIINGDGLFQLNASEAGTYYLSTPFEPRGDTLEMLFRLSVAFAPSINNFVDIFLFADGADLRAADGVMLHIGENGSNDAVELVEVVGGAKTTLSRGSDGRVASAFALNFKVFVMSDGRLEVFVEDAVSGEFQLDCEASSALVADSFSALHFFGLRTTVTSSNTKKVMFGNVSLGEPQYDHQPPQLLSLITADANTLQLSFDEPLAKNNISSKSFLSTHCGSPRDISFSSDKTQIDLFFEEPFPNGDTTTLTITEIADLSGNKLINFDTSFVYFHPSPFDIVISEIMADPEPSVGLPSAEYLEIVNLTDYDVNLRGWAVEIGSTTKVISDDCLIRRGSFLLFCGENSVEELKKFGEVYALPSFALPNAGCRLILLDDLGVNVSEITYSPSMHVDKVYSEGGYSLELVDFGNSCVGELAWTTSLSSVGGTPGAPNSVVEEVSIPVSVVGVEFFADDAFTVMLNQKVEVATLLGAGCFTVDESREPLATTADALFSSEFHLFFDEVFLPEELHLLRIGGGRTCSGAEFSAVTYSFGFPSPPLQGDVVINEILFNPVNTCVDYVELHNISRKIIDLEALQLGNITQSFPNAPDTTLKEISSRSWLLLPDEYVVLSTDSSAVMSTFENHGRHFVQMTSFPNYTNASGHPILATRDGSCVDEMVYTEAMHYPLLTVVQGVALERVEGSEPPTWHSGISDSNYGTPALPNTSAARKSTSVEVDISPKIFSPDNDGFDDITTIAINLKDVGNSAKIEIFSDDGLRRRRLTTTTLVSPQLKIIWDGCDDNNHVVDPGIYIVVVEAFDLDGNNVSGRAAVVVAR